ncbi:histidine phosphatase family protein [Lacticaseibacillus daqingensis]|uniref:histidine phosphatase family protein n=1 Tax=Lacticaseibacillus daqingensis TaxID=2486014 RepID=UPI000F766E19|nr:histidine phosphatase family protein [Lacticaseibacillus daqingensis]
MATIDLIRHGQPDTTIHDDFKRPLAAHGREQAQQLVKQLHSTPYTAIYSSPLLRALETVTPLAADHQLPIIQDERLVERKMPSWISDKAEFSDYVLHQWRDLGFANGEGESIRGVQYRYLDFMRSLPEDAWVAVGAHGTAMSSIIEAGIPGSGYAFWGQMHFGDITRVTMHDGGLVEFSSWSL